MRSVNKYITAMIFFGTISIFVKNISLPSGEIAFWRAIIAFFFLLLYLIVKKEKLAFSGIKKQLLKLFISGVAMGLNWIFLFEAYQYTTVAMATLCYYFAPVLVIIFSIFLFQEKLALRQGLCFLSASLGLILMIGFKASSKNTTLGILLGLSAAFFYALVILINKSITDVDGLIRTVLQFIAAILILFPYLLLTSGFKITTLSAIGLVNLFVIGILHTGIMYVFYFTALSNLKGSQIAILSYLDPLTAIFVSIFLLKENFTVVQLIGGAILLTSTLLSKPLKTH